MSDTIFMRSHAKISRTVSAPENDIQMMSIRAAEEHSLREHEIQRKYQSGFDDGYLAAKKELEVDFEVASLKKSEEFYRILEAFETKLTEYESVFDALVIKLAIQVAEKIVKDEIGNKSIIEASINEAIKKVMGANQILIKMNPEDYALINASGKAMMIERNFDKVKFEITDRIEVGGCVIETEIGNVDARIQSQLDVISSQLENVFSKNG